MRLRSALVSIATASSMIAGSTGGALVASPADATTAYRYTLTSFSNSSETDMYSYQSTDGLNFTQLGGGKVYTPPAGLIRDPSVTKNTSDRRYWVAYTTAWHGNTIGLASSADLKKWTFQQNIMLPSQVNIAWAPEWFSDTDGSYHLIVHLRYAGQNSASPYLITALDGAFVSWTAPVALEGLQETPMANYIDSDVVKIGGEYHIFVKNDHNKVIEHATATTLGGPYTFRDSGDWAGWGPNREGPSVYQLADGTWRITLDGYKDNRYWYSDSRDEFKTWTTPKPLPGGLSGFIRHATVLRERI